MKTRLLALLFVLSSLAWAVPPEADLAAKQGDYEKAEALYRAAQPTDAADGRRLLLRRLAIAQARNDVASAATLGQQLETALKGVDDPQVAMRLYLIQGAVASRTVDPEKAAEAFTKARPLAEKLTAAGDPGGALGLSECNSAAYLASLLVQGRPEPAAYAQACQLAYVPSFQHQATAEQPLWPLDVVRATYWSRLWIWQAFEYHFLAFRRGDHPLSAAWFQTSLGLGEASFKAFFAGYQKLNDPEFLIGAIHIALELTEAFPLSTGTPTLLTQLEPAVKAFPETQEGHYIRGRFQRSRARYALFAARDAAAALGHYDQAAAWFAKAGHHVDQMDIWAETAYVYLLDDIPKPGWGEPVEANLKQLVTLSEQVYYPFGRYFGLGFLGTMKARAGDLPGAEKLLVEALSQSMEWARAVSPEARAQLMEKPELRLFADTLVEVLVQQKRASEALEWTHRLSAEVESAGLDLSRVSRSPGTDQALRSLAQGQRERGQLQAQLQSAQANGDQTAATRLEGELANNRADFQKTINRLRQDDPDFERLLSVRPSSFSKLQASLPPEVVLVAYYPAADKTLLFTVTHDQLRIFSTPLGRQQTATAVATLRRQMVSRSPLDEAALDQLYQGLVAPLEPMLADHQVLTIIPSGMLYYLPFSALAPKGGQPLAARLAINLVTATEMPEVTGFGAAKPPATLLALANPDGSLPGATHEVEELAGLFTSPRTFVGPAATADKLDGASDVVHLATHGVLNPRNVNESYLLVAGGKLTTGEIYGLDLSKVSLVTLSACETALGERNPGSEVATLAQAFSVAGSRSMVASLWRVDDEATARLMVEFYKGLLAGQNKAEALRQAQLAVRSEARWAHPYFWSSFELIGDWH
ncbi:MAG: CHAT domain-containing protein [Vulcanimicrobiota bacterium]